MFRVEDHNSGDTMEVTNADDARAVIAARAKSYEARQLRPHYSIYDDAGVLTERVYNGKIQPLKDTTGHNGTGPDLQQLADSYAALQQQCDNNATQIAKQADEIAALQTVVAEMVKGSPQHQKHK